MRASLIVLAIILTPPFAFAQVPCQCAAALANGPGPALTNASIDWGTVATYPAPNPFNSGNQNQRADCDNKCLMRANNDPNFRNSGWWCTRINRPFQGTVVLWARLDVGLWHQLTLPNAGFNIKCCAIPPSTQGTQPPACPAGFQLVPNAPDANRCAKPAGEIMAMPPPPDRTPIGQWGFTMGKTIFQWGPPKTQQQQTTSPGVIPCG